MNDSMILPPLNPSVMEGDSFNITVMASNYTKPPMEISWKSSFDNIEILNDTEWHNDSIMVFGRTISTFSVRTVAQSGNIILTYNHPSFSKPENVLYQVNVIRKFTVTSRYAFVKQLTNIKYADFL